MKVEIVALMIGIIFGGSCRVLDLPTPAPPQLAGILAIVGIWIGFKYAAPVAEYFPNLL